MADEYYQDVSGGTLGGVIGSNIAWMAAQRARQQVFAHSYGPITEGLGGKYSKQVYTARRFAGFTSTKEELGMWNAGTSPYLGGVFAKATAIYTKPILGTQLLARGHGIEAQNAFSGMTVDSKKYGFKPGNLTMGSMDQSRIGVWLTESMIKDSKGAIQTTGAGGHYNTAFAKLMGVSGVADDAGNIIVNKAGREALEAVGTKVGTKVASRLAIGGAAHLGVMLGNAWNPIGWALMAYDVATVAQFAMEGVAKVGEAMYYRIPKAYFQRSMKSYNRQRFESIGPMAAMTQDNTNNRMRAVQAIQGSKFNGRSALGNEGQLLNGHFS